MLNNGDCEQSEFEEVKAKNEELMDERLSNSVHQDSSSNLLVVKSESFETNDHTFQSDQLKLNKTAYSKDDNEMNENLDAREGITHSKEISSLIDQDSSRSSLLGSSSASSSSSTGAVTVTSNGTNSNTVAKQSLNQNQSPVDTVNLINDRIIFDSSCNDSRIEAKVNSPHSNKVLIDHVNQEKLSNGAKMDELSSSSGNENHKSLAISSNITTTTTERGDTQEACSTATGSTPSANSAHGLNHLTSALSLAISGPPSIVSTGPSTPTISSAGHGCHSDYSHETPDTKEQMDELCPVCGDKVSGYHYGLLTCESCKGFFKRTVQNKKVYTCVADRNCHIDKSQRKRCPFCRFQKCLQVGMKLEAVRADRMRGGRNKFGPMYKRDRARRLQLLRQRQMVRAQVPSLANNGAGGSYSPGEVGGSSSFLVATINNVGNLGTQAIYSADGIKQELIQIPQLSSSTSSPDSSPSSGQPNLTPGGHSNASQYQASSSSAPGAAGGHPSGHSLATGGPVNHPEMIKWASVSNPNGCPSGNGLVKPNSSGLGFHYGDNRQGGPLLGTSSGVLGLGPLSSSGQGNGKIPLIVRELQQTAPDDKEWQSQLFGLLNNQTYNQCEVDLFELMCKVIDQSLFAQVDWARNSIFFKDLKVDDQMKLLQHAWSDMLVLDHIHQRMHNGLPDETTLPNGQKFDLLGLALLGVPTTSDSLIQCQQKLQELKFDSVDYLCVKFLLLLNPEVRGLSNYKLVHEAHEQTRNALLHYCLEAYPQMNDKYNQLMAQLPHLRQLTIRGEEFLYYKHLSGDAPTQTLLMEMLHAKRK